jgi:hypothetical protein
MYIMAGLLIVGFLCNMMVKPVDDKYMMVLEEEVQDEKAPADLKVAQPKTS